MRKLVRIIAIILFIVGLGFFAYPIVLREAFDIQANKAIINLISLKQQMMITFCMPNCVGQCLNITKSYI